MTCTAVIGDITIGSTDAHGVQWYGTLEGWEGSPASSAGSTQRAWNHGGWSPTPFLVPRNLALTGIVTAPDDTALHAALRRLSTTISLSHREFAYIEASGTVLTAMVRREGEVLARTLTDRVAEYSLGIGRAHV